MKTPKYIHKKSYCYRLYVKLRQVKDPREQDSALLIRDTERSQVRVYRAIDPDSGETRLYCHSEQKAKKDTPSVTAFMSVWKRHSPNCKPA